MIDFNGMDVIVEEVRDASHLRRAIAACLGVAEDRVAIIDDVGDYPSRDTAEVVCMRSEVHGEFSQLLSIDSAPLRLNHDSKLAAIQHLCDGLHTRCLIEVEGLNPYLMWLLSPGESPRRVALDLSTDDEDLYVIQR